MNRKSKASNHKNNYQSVFTIALRTTTTSALTTTTKITPVTTMTTLMKGVNISKQRDSLMTKISSRAFTDRYSSHYKSK